MKNILLIIAVIFLASCGSSRKPSSQADHGVQVEFVSNASGRGPSITIDLRQGESFYYPLMAVWLEDMQGNYIQTLYVAKSVATGIFRFGGQTSREWVEGPKRAPQTLPYWAHKRGVEASDGLFMPEPTNPVPDAYTGATPTTGFILNARADNELPAEYRILLEINQNWDWNRFWTNNKYPGDENYAMSAQPAVVYEAIIDGRKPGRISMTPIGHSHYSGKTGELFSDLSTLTTALRIVESVTVEVK
jgi:hypothetical protein